MSKPDSRPPTDRAWSADDIDGAARLVIERHGAAAAAFALERMRMFESVGEPDDAARWRSIVERVAVRLATRTRSGRTSGRATRSAPITSDGARPADEPPPEPYVPL